MNLVTSYFRIVWSTSIWCTLKVTVKTLIWKWLNSYKNTFMKRFMKMWQVLWNSQCSRVKCADLESSASATCWTAGVRTKLLALTHAKQEADNRLQMSESRCARGRKQLGPCTHTCRWSWAGIRDFSLFSFNCQWKLQRYVEATSSGGPLYTWRLRNNGSCGMCKGRSLFRKTTTGTQLNSVLLIGMFIFFYNSFKF